VGLACNAFEVGQIAGLADEEAKVSALGGQGARDMMAYKSGGACKEDFHSLGTLTSS
jgi:hypothetical protein